MASGPHKKLGLWTMTEDDESHNGVSTWWSLTALGAEVALLAAAEEAPAPAKKGHEGHEFRTTKSGGYCYTCDRAAAERQKAARAAAKSNG